MDLAEILEKILTAIGGGGVVGTIVIAMLKNTLAKDRAERQKLLEKVETLESEKFVELKQELHDHLKKDNPEVVQNEFKHISGTLEKISNQVTNLVTDVATLTANRQDDRDYSRNLQNNIRELREEIKNLSKK